MFNFTEKRILVDALKAHISSLMRSKSKARDPDFGPIYDKMIAAEFAVLRKIEELKI